MPVNRKVHKPQNKVRGLKAFVIMPFKAKGSEEHQHYFSIFKDYIKPTVVNLGIGVLRLDEISEPGSISMDLVKHLAEDDIVIADLTDLNPNVYYELGIRHTIRNKGTILILDDTKTTYIPFDLANYRVIKFQSTAPGLSEFKENLERALTELIEHFEESRADNPVHDWLEKNMSITKVIAPKYRIGQPDTDSLGLNGNSDPLNVTATQIIEEAIMEAEHEMIPKLIIEKAEQAVKEQDLLGFLNCVQDFIDLKSFLPSEREYSNMYYLAQRVDARSKIAKTILQLGLKVFPESSTLLSPYISFLAHSASREDRTLAKEKIQKIISIKSDNGRIEIEDTATLEKHVYLLSYMLDAYHRDGQHEEAFDITSNFIKKSPDSSTAWRNHARAMSKLGRFSKEEVIKTYKRAILVTNPSEASARWYASELSESGQLVDAVEASLHACLMDLDDPESFARLAVALSDIVQPRNLLSLQKMERQIPAEINRDAVIRCIILTMDCPEYGVEQKFLCEYAMKNIVFGVEDLDREKGEDVMLTRTDRREFVEVLYNKIKSDITFDNGDTGLE